MHLNIKEIFYRTKKLGSRELELILCGFIESHTLTEAELSDYARLLDMPNPAIYEFLMNLQECNSSLSEKISNYLKNRKSGI